MGTKSSRTTELFLSLIVIALIFSSGCGEGMEYKPIYNSAIFGGIVGAIVGHQSDKTGQGVAIGAGIGALGEFLNQIDKHPNPPRPPQIQVRTRPPSPPAPPRSPAGENIKETFIVQIHNDNGSVTPVEIRKEGDKYIGPTGEQYDKLPTEEELKPSYGL
ncbi:MAG: glycine zipper family protein [Sedimentisphaerales bacterium]